MSDFRKQVRDHYDAQSLPPEKVEAILAKGRAAADGDDKEENTVAFPAKKSWLRFVPAMAAAIVLVLSGVWWLNRPAKVSYTAIMPGVIEFFKKPELLPAPQEKAALHEMLVAKGAPKEFEIPATLMPLESAACQVLNVQGEKAYLSCYWRNNKADRNEHDLIHLLVARTKDFSDNPPVQGTPPRTREMDGWSFASWSRGDVIYMLAAAAPLEKVMPYLSAIERATDRVSPLQENSLDKMEMASQRVRFSEDSGLDQEMKDRKYPRGERVAGPPVYVSVPTDERLQTADSAESENP
jgi:hypothetical protein